MKLFFAILFGVVSVMGNQVRFDNCKVYRVTPNDASQLIVLNNLESLNGAYSFWTDIAGVGNPVDIMVPPIHELNFLEAMALSKIPFKIFINNVQEIIDINNSRSLSKLTKATFDDYMTLDEIYDYLKLMETTYPDLVTLVKGGSSYEERDIMGVHISFNKSNENNAVFLEGGIHAREWISPATVLYIMTELLTSTDPAVNSMALSYDWYIFPSFNPDGYVYTHESNRLWRKTRKPYAGGCYGSDPNRNWGFHWMDGGASSNPCSETYAGTSAFSDVETKSMSEYITSINEKLIAYIGFHSYSQLLLIPYGHSSEHVENFDDLYEVGLKAADSLAERYGTQYEVGNIVEVIYIASGGSMDWVKGTYHTPITYTYELRDTGRYGFLLPPEQIIPTSIETLDSVVTIMKEFENKLIK